MDARYPFADDAARRALLYRLPTVAMPRRLLLVGDSPDADLIAADWRGEVVRVRGLDRAGRGGRFEAVALLDDDPLTLSLQLRAAAELLVPGGTVIGAVQHLSSFRRLARPTGWWAWLRGAWSGTGIVRARGCCKALLAAGFGEPRVFYVQPDLDAPMGLIATDRVAARAQFLRAAQATRGQHGRVAFGLRCVLARLGLGGVQQGHLFFWANRPC